MGTQWLNAVLALTNRIYQRKLLVQERVGVQAVRDVVVLIVLELALGLLSFPLYIGMRPARVAAFLEERGTYERIAYDYTVRRVLTLTGMSVLLVLWMVKLLVIVLVPRVAGPLPLYAVSPLEPVDLLARELVLTETRIQTARVAPEMTTPVVTTVEKGRRGTYTFRGTGQPETSVVLFLSDVQTVIFTGDVDAQGAWAVTHAQEDFTLREGNHAMLAFSYDPARELRSTASPEQYFKVRTRLIERLVQHTDNVLNVTLVAILALGVLLTVLTL